MAHRKAKFFLCWVVVLQLLSWGCAGLGSTKIGDILANPGMFSAKEISIHGKVTNALKIPFVATSIYSVRDDSGEINVRTEGEVPMVGADVRVKGTLDTVAVFGQETVGLHLREIERW
jgi:hypothetical protein